MQARSTEPVPVQLRAEPVLLHRFADAVMLFSVSAMECLSSGTNIILESPESIRSHL